MQLGLFADGWRSVAPSLSFDNSYQERVVLNPGLFRWDTEVDRLSNLNIEKDERSFAFDLVVANKLWLTGLLNPSL